MKEFARTIFKFKIDGQVFEVEKARLKQIREMKRKIKEEDADAFELQYQFLIDSGLPAEVVDSLEGSAFDEIALEVLGSKKSP